jgi:hypothetical protein
MKTAMQEHIEWLKATLDICKEHAPSLVNCLELCINDAESKLEMEKEQMIDFAENYEMWESENYPRKTFEQYYNETYGK